MHGDAEYADLFDAVIEGRLEPQSFVRAYMRLWEDDRDEAYAQAAAWSERHDLALIEKLNRGEIETTSFERQWAALWGYAGGEQIEELKNKAFAACDVFRVDPQHDYQLGPDAFRKEIAHIAESFRSLCRM